MINIVTNANKSSFIIAQTPDYYFSNVTNKKLFICVYIYEIDFKIPVSKF